MSGSAADPGPAAERTTKQSVYDRVDARRGTVAGALDRRLRAGHAMATSEGMVGLREVAEGAAVIGLGAGSLLLDLGCGSAEPSLMIRDRTGCRVLGLDVSSARVARIPRSVDVAAAVIDLDSGLPVSPGSAHGAVQFDSIVHLRDKVAHLARVRAALRPGGTLVLTSSTNSPLDATDVEALGDVPGTIWRLSTEALLEALAAAGFAVAELRSRRVEMIAWHRARAEAWMNERNALVADSGADAWRRGLGRAQTVARLLGEERMDMVALVARRD